MRLNDNDYHLLRQTLLSNVNVSIANINENHYHSHSNFMASQLKRVPSKPTTTFNPLGEFFVLYP